MNTKEERPNIMEKVREQVVSPRPAVLTTPVLSEVVLSRLILAIAFSIGSFMRIWQINAMGYNTDEAVYAGQAAAIAGVPGLKDVFPIFRAHPLLFQFILSVFYRFEFNDLIGRLVAAAIGIGTVFLAYQVGKTMYGRLAGALAALFLALMPYHVVVTRQVLLDGPMVFFATLTLYMLTRFGKSNKVIWLYAAGATMGLTFLGKETSIVLLGAVYAFLALSPEVRVRIRDLIVATGLMGLVISPFPLALMFAGGSNTGRNYLAWQLFRRPNHELSFYPEVVPPAMGYLVIAAAVVGLVLLWKQHSWREKLLLSWIIVPVAFFQLWPVKGFQYLLPIAPAIALLAGRFLGFLATQTRRFEIPKTLNKLPIHPIFSWLVIAATAVSLSASTWQKIQPEISSTFLAGTGGVPGGREAGSWIRHNVPMSARFMTIGPSMANIVQFYGERKAWGLAVSPNPLHRNPSYEPIPNPDRQIRDVDLQYLVWDSFSAARSPIFSDTLLGYVNKYNGRAIHTESITVLDANGNLVEKPVIIIYEVHP